MTATTLCLDARLKPLCNVWPIAQGQALKRVRHETAASVLSGHPGRGWPGDARVAIGCLAGRGRGLVRDLSAAQHLWRRVREGALRLRRAAERSEADRGRPQWHDHLPRPAPLSYLSPNEFRE